MRLNPAAQLQNPPPMRPQGNVTPQPSPEQEAQAAASAAKVLTSKIFNFSQIV